MTIDNPIFGVGLDSYGDWYRRSRTIEATLRRGPDVTSNAAHNAFLDISSYGGFPLVLIYIVLIILVINHLQNSYTKIIHIYIYRYAAFNYY
jgi:O-antigen ligase